MGHRKGGDQRTLLAHVVAVVQMVDRHRSIVEGSFFNALQAQNLGMKVVVFLRATGRDGNVMVPGDVVAG